MYISNGIIDNEDPGFYIANGIISLTKSSVFATTQNGNYNDGATWGNTSPGVEGVDFPTLAGGADDITITHAVTITSDIGIGTLVSGSNGTLTCGAGGSLTDGSVGYTVNLNYATLNSTATSANWFKFLGSIAVKDNSGDVDTRTRRKIVDIQYVAFDTTGIVYLGSGDSRGTLVPKIKVLNCTFIGCQQAYFGYGGYAPAVKTNVDYSDFRNIATYVKLLEGDTAGGNTFTYNTVKDVLYVSNSDSTLFDITGTVFIDGYFWYSNAGGNSTGFFAADTTGSAQTAIASGIPGATITESYFYGGSGSTNWHGATEKHIQNCVYECREALTDEPNLLNFKDGSQHTGNLFIGVMAAAFNIVGDKAFTTALLAQHNTCYATGSHVHQGIFLAENGEMTGTTLSFKDNLVGFAASDTNEVYHDNDVPSQVIDLLDKNAYFNCSGANKLDNVTVTTDTDFNTFPTTLDPQFVDTTRSLNTYGASIGGTGTESDTLNLFLARNGYNSTTKTQSDTPSSASISGLISFLRAGFTPQNPALKGAASDGGDIGALAVQTASTGSRVSKRILNIGVI